MCVKHLSEGNLGRDARTPGIDVLFGIFSRCTKTSDLGVQHPYL